jgi:hypothetical protein
MSRQEVRWFTAAIFSVLGLVVGANSAAASSLGIPKAPYTACPQIGQSPSCAVLLVVYPDQSITVYQDPSVGPYDGVEDTLVGVVNQSDITLHAITVNGPGSGLGQLDGDGLCAFSVAGCPFGLTGYEGPNTAIKTDPARPDSAEIDFPAGLKPGDSTYFSLEGGLSLADLTVHNGPLAVTGTFGGYWQNPSNLYYYYAGGHRYAGNVYQGGVNWSSAGTKVKISAWKGVPLAIHIYVSDAAINDTYWAITRFAGSGNISECTACVYTKNTITFNTNTVDKIGDFMRTKVATHEFGHSISLRHPRDVGLTSTASIMNQGVLSYNKPQTYDINLVKAVYP